MSILMWITNTNRKVVVLATYNFQEYIQTDFYFKKKDNTFHRTLMNHKTDFENHSTYRLAMI
jgi:hypothetical protein